MDTVILNKSANIENGIKIIKDDYKGNEEQFWDNFTKQDSVILNIQRAVQATIDLAAYIVILNKWGVPGSSRQSFELLQSHGFIEQDLSEKLKNMVGFRNIAIHENQQLNVDIFKKT